MDEEPNNRAHVVDFARGGALVVGSEPGSRPCFDLLGGMVFVGDDGPVEVAA